MTAVRTSAAVGNVVWALFLGFGVLVDGTAYAKAGFLFFGIIAFRNVFAVFSRQVFMDKPTILMNGFLALFAVTIILIGQYPYDRLGAVGLAIISAFTAVALCVGREDSWLKRLRKQPATPSELKDVEVLQR